MRRVITPGKATPVFPVLFWGSYMAEYDKRAGALYTYVDTSSVHKLFNKQTASKIYLSPVVTPNQIVISLGRDFEDHNAVLTSLLDWAGFSPPINSYYLRDIKRRAERDLISGRVADIQYTIMVFATVGKNGKTIQFSLALNAKANPFQPEFILLLLSRRSKSQILYDAVLPVIKHAFSAGLFVPSIAQPVFFGLEKSRWE